MAKVRIGFSTQFELENELVGIGTDNPTNTLQALGNIKSSNAKAVGVSTFTTFDGFVDNKASISGLEGSEQGALSGEIIIEGEVIVSSGATFRSGPENLTVTDNFTLPGISEDKPSVGTMRFNEDLVSLEFYTGVEWRLVNSIVDMGNRGRGVFGGGAGVSPNGPNGLKTLDYINIATRGDAINFGELATAVANGGACSSSTRGIFSYGRNPSYLNSIEYIALASGGGGIDFGDISTGDNCAYNSNCSSSTRGMFNGGYKSSPSPYWNAVIEYVQIATTSNAIDFGDPYQMVYAHASLSSSTRGVMLGGYGSNSVPYVDSVIQSYEIASKGNATRFGDLADGRWNCNGASNSVRGVVGGGSTPTVSVVLIDYITIASEGNATAFGDLSLPRNGAGAVASQTRACFGGGYEQPAKRNVIDYIDIATTGDAMDFGDLISPRFRIGACSDSHGGLGGF